MIMIYGGAPPPDGDGPNRFLPAMPFITPASPVQPLIGVGWECPRCRSINAPYVTKCDCKPEAK